MCIRDRPIGGRLLRRSCRHRRADRDLVLSCGEPVDHGEATEQRISGTGDELHDLARQHPAHLHAQRTQHAHLRAARRLALGAEWEEVGQHDRIALGRVRPEHGGLCVPLLHGSPDERDAEGLGRGRDVAAATEALGIPLVWGAVQEWHAQATVFWSNPPESDPVVLTDLFPLGTEGEPPSCAQVGVLGALCVQVGGMLAGEVVKLITGAGDPLLGRLAMIDGLSARQHEIAIRSAVSA